MATIKDVALRSGFSPTTVSFVLNDAPLAKNIPSETKRKIQEAARALAYTPNKFARFLRTGRSNTIGIVLFDITDPYCTAILRGVQTVLARESALVPLLADAQNDRKQFQRHVATLLESQVEGLIVLGNSVYPEGELFKLLQECQVPVVVTGRTMEGAKVGSVTIRNQEGAALAFRHLYSLGHRQIAVLRGPKEMVDSSQRWEGVVQEAKRCGLSLLPELVLESPLETAGHVAGYDLCQQLLATKMHFTAIHAYDDLTALGAIRALAEAGRTVPRDCSITGFDDIDLASFFNPPLTTIRQDLRKLGHIAGEMLLHYLQPKEGATVKAHRRMKPYLEVRSSTAPPPRRKG